MEVLIEFGVHPVGSVADAVWIVDTPANRAWFEARQQTIDANSAVFQDASDPLAIIEHVFDHHPTWTQIIVRGETLTPEIEQGVRDCASVVKSSATEFRLKRREWAQSRRQGR